jgi:crotonobetainyl-CoA:carnitine CoA-transferase CaiB-like acyl-CoA transferase
VGSAASKPLAGVRVVDLTQIYQGPYAAFLMAMAGAEVVKVEPPGGERLRGVGGAETPLSFAMLNSSKKGVTLDVKHPKGKALLLELVQCADVLLENLAPGKLQALGVGWEELRKVNPKLVYVSGSGYGLSGPDCDLLAMDHTIQAACGLMSVTGDRNGPPSRSGGAPADILGGIHMYAGALSGLLARQRTGQGTAVEVSMIESMYFTLCSEFSYFHRTGKQPPRNDARSPGAACPYGRYRCSDGWIAIICVSEVHWQSILRTIDREELAGSDTFANALQRIAREDEVDGMIEAWSSRLTRDEAYLAMRRARVPVAPVRHIAEVMFDPHLHERGTLKLFEHEALGDIVLPGSPIRYSAYESEEPSFFPDAGQHNREVYVNWLGLAPEALDELSAQGVI